MTKIKKFIFYVDYTTTPNNLAVTPGINVIGKELYTYDTVFNVYSDSKLLKPTGTMITRSVMYKDATNKTLTGESTNNIRISRNGDQIEMDKRAHVVQEYVDNTDLKNYPFNHIIASTQFQNLSIDNIFNNGKKVNIVWSDIKYHPSKKRYKVWYEERDKN